jgi:hypothetical protein
MPIGDAALVGRTTRSAGITIVHRVNPPDSASANFVGPPINADAALVGWNASATGIGVVGRGAPNGVGVMGIINPSAPAVPGDIGVFGRARVTGVMGTATTPATVLPGGTITGGTGVAGTATAGGVGVHGRAAFGSLTEVGVAGSSITGTGVAGFSTLGGGVVGSSTFGFAVAGVSTSGNGVDGTSTTAAGVVGRSIRREGVKGESQLATGVVGITHSQDQEFVDAGVIGVAMNSRSRGVWGESIFGEGVFGYSDRDVGVRGEAPTQVAVLGEGGRAGVCGISEQGIAVVGASRAPPGSARWAGYFAGNVVINGNLVVLGNKNAATPRTGGKHQLLYCVESPESWLEDFGEARLANGRARIRIDRDFRKTIDTRSYHVFVSAYGPEPVFVSKRSRNGFEIRAVPREGARMPRSLRCSYRIVARRRSVKAPRLQQVRLPSASEFLPELEARPSRKRVAELRQQLDRPAAASKTRGRRRAKAALAPTVPAKPPVFPRPPKVVIRDEPRGRRAR